MSESVLQLVTRLDCPTLTITAGPFGLAQRLREHGRTVVVSHLPTARLMGIRSAPVRNAASVALASVRGLYRIWRTIRNFRADVTYTADLGEALLGAEAIRWSGSKWVLGVRGTPSTRRHWRRPLAYASGVVALSHEMAAMVSKLGGVLSVPGIASKITVIRNGVDLEVVRRHDEARSVVRASIGATDEDTVCLMVAAFDERKNQLEFIRHVLPLAMLRAKTMRMVFAGGPKREADVSYYDNCLAAVQAAGLGNRTVFPGEVSEVWPWYAASDLVLLASRSEGMARSMIEGMAAGRPVVTFDVCSSRETLDSTGAGIVVPQGDWAEYVAAVQRMIHAPEFRIDSGQRALQYARQNLDIRVITAKYLELFTDVAQNGGQNRVT